MNYQQLQREIELQNEATTELARYRSRDDHEPADSQRLCLMQDDRESGDY